MAFKKKIIQVPNGAVAEHCHTVLVFLAHKTQKHKRQHHVPFLKDNT